MFAAHEAGAACSEKRFARSVLRRARGARRRTAPRERRRFQVRHRRRPPSTELVAKVGPPDAATGTRTSYFIWCFADGTDLTVATKDRIAIESVRYNGKQIYKRGKKKE